MNLPSSLDLLTHRLDLLRAERASALADSLRDSTGDVADRATNVQGAFQVPDERSAAVAGRRLVLVDDVLTSGATVDTCARALLRAGAVNVDVLVFARVVQGIRAPI